MRRVVGLLLWLCRSRVIHARHDATEYLPVEKLSLVRRLGVKLPLEAFTEGLELPERKMTLTGGPVESHQAEGCVLVYRIETDKVS